MLQGASSNAGKSVLATALCRMLLQDGYRVAPFKAQNMSLNSYVTLDGRELGRAQATQAMACRLEPDAAMNPVLLKPTTDVGSQVIVMGRPVGNMDVKTYFRYKPELFKQVAAAYDGLAADFDVMVIEGAGSPAEINLKAHDIVNMRMAAYAQATVLLVADIDRGGAFASLVGTMELLDPWERELIAGFALNRFRGDPSLLGPALDVTTQRTGKPFFGVVPYLRDLGLPEEDSVSFKDGATIASARSGEERVEIALLDLPHISNFTDFDALAAEPDVRVRIARSPADLSDAFDGLDALILPGSKSTLADLRYLEETGLAACIAALAAAGRVEIVGVCGGYQMLGAWIEDAQAVECAPDAEASGARGLGLLPVTTRFETDKILGRTRATHLLSGCELYGYEIHHGRTRLLESVSEAVVVAVRGADGQELGHATRCGRIWGSYLHGLFDADGFRRWFVDKLRTGKGLAAMNGARATYDLEPALDRLAEHARRALDWKRLYAAAGIV